MLAPAFPDLANPAIHGFITLPRTALTRVVIQA